MTDPAPQPTAAHKRLDAFVGTWRVEGRTFSENQKSDDPRASAVAWNGENSWEWPPGASSCAVRATRSWAHTLISTEIIGHDDAKGGYSSHMFENAGFHPEYRGEVEGDVWTFSDASSRSRMVFSDDNRKLKIEWEWRNDGSDWLPPCDLVATGLPLGQFRRSG